MTIKERIRRMRKLVHLRRKRKVANGDFVRRRRFRLSLVNMSSLTTVFEVRGRKWNMVAAAIILFILAGAIWVMGIMYTPLRNILPLKMQSDLRDDYLDLSARLDSASQASSANERFAQNLLNILADTATVSQREAADASKVSQPLPPDSLMESSENERNFVRRFEDAERYNLSVLSPIAAEGMAFYSPVSGVQTESRVSEAGIPSIRITAAKTTPVSAIYRGTVVSTYFTTSGGITVVVQHPNEFVSIYSGLSETFVAKGEKVNSGTRLGMAMADRYPVIFELWHNGAPLPPEDYIVF